MMGKGMHSRSEFVPREGAGSQESEIFQVTNQGEGDGGLNKRIKRANGKTDCALVSFRFWLLCCRLSLGRRLLSLAGRSSSSSS